MELRLVRDVCGADCTLGKLFVDGQFDCYTVEDVVRPNGRKVHGKTAIPEGRYKVIVSPSPRFGRDLPLLENVANFEGVRIHPGNTAEDTEGCIIPGRVRTPRGVAQSRLAFEKLFAALKAELAGGGKIWLSVTTPEGDARSAGAKLASIAGERSGVRDINNAGLALIKSFEGIPDGDPTTVKIDPYLDPVGIWTIGWGHAISVGGQLLRGKEKRKAARDLYPGGITLEQAELLLRGDLLDTCRDVAALIKVPLTDNQFAALVSFAFNCGGGNLAKSTLLKKLNQGDYAGAAAEFGRWNKAGGKVLAGLTRRREAEAELFQSA
jgi:lysozyme